MENDENTRAKSAQRKALIVLSMAALLATALAASLLLSHAQNRTANKETLKFEEPFAEEKAASYVLEKVQSQVAAAEKKTAAMQRQLDGIKTTNTGDGPLRTMMAMATRIEALERQAAEQRQRATMVSQPFEQRESARFETVHVRPPPSIREDHLALDEAKDNAPLRSPETYVPAGTFVKAVMLGGADASAAVSSPTAPTPMLFRIIADGTLPNHEKGHLKGCMVTAAVVGDISSERGLIRLETLSCVLPNKEIVDQPAEGTVFGPEGKNGVRGVPVWREGALLQRAFAAGTLSGISDGISQSFTASSISAEGAVQTIDAGKVFQYGAANGTGKAMDKLADYNIKRAEQYHPVIQLTAGTVVDIVFLKGLYMEGRPPKEKTNENEKNKLSNFLKENAPREMAAFPPAAIDMERPSLGQLS